MSKADSLPLREKFTTAERLTRELIDHVDQGFLTRIQHLRRACRKDEADGVTDKTVRHECAQLIASQAFADELTTELWELLDSVAAEMEPMINGRDL